LLEVICFTTYLPHDHILAIYLPDDHILALYSRINIMLVVWIKEKRTVFEYGKLGKQTITSKSSISSKAY
jgi:hypothetical protein